MIEVLRSKSNWIIAVLLLILFSLLFYINIPFMLPAILAGIFALGLNDFVTRNSARWKAPRGLLITLLILLGFILFWAPLSLAVYRIVTIVSLVKVPENLNSAQVIDQLNILKDFAVNSMQKISSLTGVDMTTPVRETLDSLIRRVGELVFNFSSTAIRSTPSILFNGLLFTIFLIVFLSQSNQLKRFFLKYSPLQEPLTEKLVHVFKLSCAVTLFSTFVIGVIQAGIVGLGSLIFSEGDFWLVMPLAFVLAFIPVIGAGPVGFTLALLAFIGGRMGSGIGMLVFSSVAGTIDSFLKPLLIGGKDLKISPLLGFTCVLGAIIMFGLSGLLIGPVVMNLFVRMVPLLLTEFPKNSKS